MSPLKTLALLVLIAGPSFGDDRPADKILADLNAVEAPKPPEDRNDIAAVRDYIAKMQKAQEQRSDLIGELLKSHPESPELPSVIGQRWSLSGMPGAKGAAIKAEIEDVLANGKNEALVAEAAFFKAASAFRPTGLSRPDAAKMQAATDEFIKRFPKDERGVQLLTVLASRMTDPAKKAEIEKRIEKDYPDSLMVKQMAAQKAAERKMTEAIGKPFAIEFTDAIKGSTVSMATLKGKVVIVDFWATWCGPCVQEMPKMKKLYAEYKDKGVEFIGVSLDQPEDQGGLKSLKDYVAKNEIGWPQYYQGKGWQSDYSMSWGINSIPRVFAIDAEGKLFSVEARGKLEKMIPELLEKAKKDSVNP